MTQPQLTLFPLHPENLFEEKDLLHENVAYLFDGQEGGTLNGLLDGCGGVEEDSCSLSPSLTYAQGGGGGQESSDGASTLAQAALRHKEREGMEEEKWVLYSDVVENKEEEITSSSAGGGLSLKLDYQQILNAWSDKGSFYVRKAAADSSRAVPDQANDGYTDVEWKNDEGLWSVPEGEGSSVIEEGSERRMGTREARVMRYKEKRQSRLFSKRIRYQVRKLNAEKRPRMKGRFVKRKMEG